MASARPTSPAQEDYLRALHGLGAATAAVATSRLAAELRVSPASASEMLAKLAARELVAHDHYRGARLTEPGVAIALEMTRHHRLLETYLVQALGYSWDEVHEEADRLEHAISERLEQRMWEALGRPATDPHGDPIPALDGSLAPVSTRTLADAPAGARVRVTRTLDRDPEMLRAISALGVVPGVELSVLAASRWESPIEVAVLGEERRVPLGLARAIFIDSPPETMESLAERADG